MVNRDLLNEPHIKLERTSDREEIGRLEYQQDWKSFSSNCRSKKYVETIARRYPAPFIYSVQPNPETCHLNIPLERESESVPFWVYQNPIQSPPVTHQRPAKRKQDETPFIIVDDNTIPQPACRRRMEEVILLSDSSDNVDVQVDTVEPVKEQNHVNPPPPNSHKRGDESSTSFNSLMQTIHSHRDQTHQL